MPLSWNEIRNRAHEFSNRWENETSEDAEAKTFWTEFFNVFGTCWMPARNSCSPRPQAGEGPGERGSATNSASLADFYDPLTMPPALVKAHQTLDRAVDACYRKTAFANDAQRVEFLFEHYQQLTSLLPAVKKPSKRT